MGLVIFLFQLIYHIKNQAFIYIGKYTGEFPWILWVKHLQVAGHQQPAKPEKSWDEDPEGDPMAPGEWKKGATPGCLVYIGNEKTTQVCGDYLVNHHNDHYD